MPGIVQRYLFRQIGRNYLIVIATIVTIMSLENLTRLAAIVERTDAPGPLLGLMMATLLPEYLGVAIPIAVFLATAMTIRTLSQRSEWQMLEGLGMTPARYMAVPMALALFAGVIEMGVRLEIQPAGESALDAVSNEIVQGFHGMGFFPGDIVQLGDTTLTADRAPGSAPGELQNVFVRHGQDTIEAGRAIVAIASDGTLIITLHDGKWVRAADARHQTVLFGSYVLRLPGIPPMAAKRGIEKMDRLGLRALVAGAVAEQGQRWRPVSAALASRIESGFFCLLLPLFALGLGAPPKRGEGGVGLFLGIVLLVIHFKTADAVEATTEFPVLGAVIHATLWTVAAGLLARGTVRCGPGYVDAWIASRVSRLVDGARRIAGFA